MLSLETLESPVANQHQELAACVQELYRTTSEPGHPVSEPWRRKLESLYYVYSVDEFLGLQAGPISITESHHARLLIPQIEQARLTLVSAALCHERRHDPGRRIEEVEDSLGPIEHTESHLTHARFEDRRLISLPTIISDESCFQVADELTAMAHTHPGETWIVDFSAVSALPVLMLANLLGTTERLRRAGGDMLLCWVRPWLFDHVEYSRICAHFDLTLVGGRLFSKPSGPAHDSTLPTP